MKNVKDTKKGAKVKHTKGEMVYEGGYFIK